MEYIDVLDENLNVVAVRSREEVHIQGLWHQTFHCWVVRRIGRVSHVLFQKRGPNVKGFPNLYDISAAGHILAGESPEDGVRELEEELGLSARFEDLHPLGVYPLEIYGATFTDREYCHVFAYESSLPLERYQLQMEEVAGVGWARLDEAIEFFSGKREHLDIRGVLLGEQGVASHEPPQHRQGVESHESPRLMEWSESVALKQFVHDEGDYYLKVMLAIQEWMERD